MADTPITLINKPSEHPHHTRHYSVQDGATSKYITEPKLSREKGKRFQILPTLNFCGEEDTLLEQYIELSISENYARKLLMITADINNLAPVWAGGIEASGIPIQPGERLVIEGSNAIEFSALTDHVLYVAEIIWK